MYGLAALILPLVANSGIANATTTISIDSCQELQKIGNDSDYPLDGDYVLGGNISCAVDTASGGALYNGGDGFEPIGYNNDDFAGTFNGQGFTITGLNINRGSSQNIGLFSTASNAIFENFRLTNGSIEGDGQVGAVVGVENDSTFINIYSNLTVTGDDDIGGIIGSNEPGSDTAYITRVRSAGSITGESYAIGGIVGDTDGDLVIDQSYFTGSVTNIDTLNSSAYVGGIVGDSDGSLIISNTFSTGSVTAAHADSVGGLVGWSDHVEITDVFATGAVTGRINVGGLMGYTDDGTLANSYAAGAVANGSEVGGLIGTNANVVVTASFFNTTTTGQSDGTGAGGDPSDEITSLNSTQMRTSTPFTDVSWSFTDIWTQTAGSNNGFPYFRWTAENQQSNPVTSKNAQLTVPFGCYIEDMSVDAESANTKTDSDYNYPVGLMNFTIECGGTGFTTTITQYFYGVSENQSLVARKYNPSTQTYTNIPNAVVSFVTISGQSAAKVVYSIKDGGSLDSDGSANGVIVDPSGLALSTIPGLPNTGLGAN